MCTDAASQMLVAGGVIQGAGNLAGSLSAANTLEGRAAIAESDARLKEIQANDAAQRGETEAVQTRQAASSAVAQQVSATVGAGLDVGGGTAQEVVLSTELAGAADVLTVRRNTRKQVWSLKQSAKNLRSQAKQAKSAARTTRILSPITTVAPIIQGFGQAKLVNKQKLKPKTGWEINA